MPASLIALSLAAALSFAEPVAQESDGEGILRPIYRIAHEAIEECSGIVWLDGAFYIHNDSGNDPLLFRSSHLSFPEDGTEVLRVPDAEAIDWEDITVLDGDLIIGDMGDNFRERSQLTLHRVRYVADDGRLELVAVYPFQYPDDPHDAEALAVIDGTIHLITKARDETITNVYVFDDLRDVASLPQGEVNVPRFVGRLEIGEGEEVTAADYDPVTETLLLMTYTHILQYPKERLEGPPVRSTLIGARQNESICFRGSQIVFTNEQRDVFVVDRFLSRRFTALLPERGETVLPICDGPGREQGRAIPLKHSREGEEIRWCLSDDRLLIHGRLEYGEDFHLTDAPITELIQLGSGIFLTFGGSPHLELSGQEFQIAVGLSLDKEPSIWQLDLTNEPIGVTALQDVEIEATAEDGVFTFEMALPLSLGLADYLEDTFLFDVHGMGLHGDDEEVRFSGIDIYTVFRPYLWGEVTLQP
jgi:hypothetical protein